MTLDFLTARDAVIAVLVLVPVAALFRVRARARQVRRTVGLVEPAARAFATGLVALLAVAAALGLAAAQPVLERTRTVSVRTDAEAFVVLDISRSMLARQGTGGAMRIQRAKSAATALRAELATVPVGIASLTDRVLPHLFPSADARVFETTLAKSVAIERPPPRSSFATGATRLEALANIRTRRYFSPSARKRLLLVLTDGETQPVVGARLGSLFRSAPAIEVVFVQFWHGDERVFTGGAAEPQYRADPSSRAVLDGIARSVSGSVYSEHELDAAGRKARELLGSGTSVVRGEYGGRTPLAPYLAAAALAPLAWLLVRRER